MKIEFDTDTQSALDIMLSLIPYLDIDRRKQRELWNYLSGIEDPEQLQISQLSESALDEAQYTIGQYGKVSKSIEGYFVKKGTKIKLRAAETCPDKAKAERKKYIEQGYIDQNGIVLRDLGPFSSASLTAAVVLGCSVSGNRALKAVNAE